MCQYRQQIMRQRQQSLTSATINTCILIPSSYYSSSTPLQSIPTNIYIQIPFTISSKQPLDTSTPSPPQAIFTMEALQRGNTLLSEKDSERVEFYFACRNLTDLDPVAPTFLTVQLVEHNKPPKLVFKSTKNDTHEPNPDFFESLTLDFVFEEKQNLIFEVFTGGINHPRLIGRAESSVGEVFGSRQKRIIKTLVSQTGKEAGKILVRCVAVPMGNAKFTSFTLQATGLPDMTFLWFFGGTSPFFRLTKRRGNDIFPIYQSETVRDNRNPTFKPCEIPERKLCENDDNYPINLEIFNHNDNGSHELIGTCTFTLSQLARPDNFVLVKNGKRVGQTQVVFRDVRRYQNFMFTDFVQAGLQMQLQVYIDFTGSNGVFTRPESLHYIGGPKRTAYEDAIIPVGDILLDYDADKMVPVYGFGAKVRMPNFSSQNMTHHCFPLNGDMDKPEVPQIHGILESYRKCVPHLQFSGPTYFTPLLREAMARAEKIKNNRNEYLILLIMTDGAIHDLPDVEDCLVNCGRLPMSVIIVGIGEGDFKLMERIDDDNCEMVDKNGRKTERDLVQFVPFRQFNNDGKALSRQVLEELPRQVAEYYKLMGIKPQDFPRGGTDIDFQMMNSGYPPINPPGSNNMGGAVGGGLPYSIPSPYNRPNILPPLNINPYAQPNVGNSMSQSMRVDHNYGQSNREYMNSSTDRNNNNIRSTTSKFI